MPGAPLLNTADRGTAGVNAGSLGFAIGVFAIKLASADAGPADPIELAEMVCDARTGNDRVNDGAVFSEVAHIL